MTASLRILSSKADSNTWESFTRSELKLESVHQETPRSDIFRKRATEPLLKQKHRQKHLTWAKGKITGLLLQSPLFRWKYILHFIWKSKSQSLEEEWRGTERIHVAWSPVWSFHSQWWFELSCHLLVLVHCVFWSPQSTQPSTRKFKSTPCFLLLTSFMEMLISFCSRTWHLPTLLKVPKAGLMTMVLLCLIGQQTRLTWTAFANKRSPISTSLLSLQKTYSVSKSVVWLYCA